MYKYLLHITIVSYILHMLPVSKTQEKTTLKKGKK